MKYLLILVLSFAPASYANEAEYNPALKKLAQAYYKYSDLDDFTKALEKKYVPKEIKKYGATLGVINALLIEKRIQLKWSFK